MERSPDARLAIFEEDGWELEDGEALHREAPNTFHIPAVGRRINLKPHDVVKLIFRIRLVRATGEEYEEVERMWVIVTGRDGALYRGVLDNDPYCTDGIKSGMPVDFDARHVIAIYGETLS